MSDTAEKYVARDLSNLHRLLLTKTDVQARFWAKVEKTSDCWNWIAGLTGSGYGRFNLTHKSAYPAHRIAYYLEFGSLDPLLTIDHLCRNLLCVNPSHLQLISKKENLLRGMGLPAQNSRKTHCCKGNNIVDESGGRVRELPCIDIYTYSRAPEEKGCELQFRLVYRGGLPAQGRAGGATRLREKHAIRKQFHKQLAELWRQHPLLISWNTKRDDGKSLSDLMAADYGRYGFNWVPLVSNYYGLACSLDILFLRRDNPGHLVESGGDIDNRIKVLFDAMRIPKESVEVQGFTPDVDEDPFYCLLEDDSLINEVRVNTDRLLIPLEGDEAIHDVVLVVHVKTLIANPRKTPIDFYT